MRKRGLLRTIGRTAVISGTATAVSGRVARTQHRNFAAEQAALAGGPTASAAGPEAAGGENDLVASLERLAALHTAGELSDGEFRSAKARVLAH